MAAIPTQIVHEFTNNEKNSPFAVDWFTLAATSDTLGITNPQNTEKAVTVKVVVCSAAGNLRVVSPSGNKRTIVVTSAMLDTVIHGPFNAIEATLTTVPAANIMCYV